ARGRARATVSSTAVGAGAAPAGTAGTAASHRPAVSMIARPRQPPRVPALAPRPKRFPDWPIDRMPRRDAIPRRSRRRCVLAFIAGQDSPLLVVAGSFEEHRPDCGKRSHRRPSLSARPRPSGPRDRVIDALMMDMDDRTWMRARCRAVVAMLGLALCATTTAGCSDDPFDFGGPRSCEPADQNAWVYGLMQQAYLFADELPEVDPLAYDEPSELMGELRVAPDRWSRISDKSRTEALYQKGKN